MNPLPILYRQLALPALGPLFADPPEGTALEYCLLLEAVNARARPLPLPPVASETAQEYLCRLHDSGRVLRLVACPPLDLQIDPAQMDSLLWDPIERARRGWTLPFPRTRGALRSMVRDLKRTRSRPKTARRLSEEFIPTVTGLREWRHTTVAQHVKFAKGVGDELPITPAPCLLQAWRSVLVGEWIPMAVAHDPLAGPRYGIEVDVSGPVRITTSGRVPLVVREWVMESLGRTGWAPARGPLAARVPPPEDQA